MAFCFDLQFTRGLCVLVLYHEQRRARNAFARPYQPFLQIQVWHSLAFLHLNSDSRERLNVLDLRFRSCEQAWRVRPHQSVAVALQSVDGGAFLGRDKIAVQEEIHFVFLDIWL